MGMDDQINNIKNFLATDLTDLWANTLGAIPDILQVGADKVTDAVFGIFAQAEEQQWANMLNMFVSAGLLNTDAKENLMRVRNLGAPIDTVAYFMLFYGLIKSTLDVTTWAASGHLRQELFSQLSPEIPHFSEFINAAFIAPEKTTEVREAMKRSGYTEEHIDLCFLANYRLYDENMIRNLYLRGVLDTDGLYERMRELGYTDTRTQEISQSWNIIPSPQDLIYLVGKEAFEPETIAQLGLDEEYPAEVEPWFEKQGLSESWVHKYWQAHWAPPSLELGFEMYQRDVISRDVLEALFKTVEIPPFFRDKLLQIAYHPYTRVDIRRMHDRGVLTDQETFDAYRHTGYSPDKAEKMLEFTIAYNSDGERELTKSEIIKGFTKYAISESDAVYLLQEIGYPEQIAQYHIDMAINLREEEYEEEMLSVVKEKYIDNLVTKLQVQDWLGKMNLPANQIDRLIALWDLKRLTDAKKPSKTDLDKFVKHDIIDDSRYYLEMEKLGYSRNYIDWYYQLALKTK